MPTFTMNNMRISIFLNTFDIIYLLFNKQIKLPYPPTVSINTNMNSSCVQYLEKMLLIITIHYRCNNLQ
jgi:hypothetical protein